jgi:hypothetical protein
MSRQNVNVSQEDMEHNPNAVVLDVVTTTRVVVTPTHDGRENFGVYVLNRLRREGKVTLRVVDPMVEAEAQANIEF